MRIETNTADAAPANAAGQSDQGHTVTELCARRVELEKKVDALWDRREAAGEAAERETGDFPAFLESRAAAECGNRVPISLAQFEAERHWRCHVASADAGGETPPTVECMKKIRAAERQKEAEALAYYERRAAAYARHNVEALELEAEAATGELGELTNRICGATPRDLVEAEMQLSLIGRYYAGDEGAEFAVQAARRILAMAAH